MSLLKELMSTHRSLADTILESDLLQLILEDDPTLRIIHFWEAGSVAISHILRG